jgi:hypothetical protein
VAIIAIVMALAPAAAAQPLSALAINVAVAGDDLVVTLNKGSDNGVTHDLRARCKVGKRTVDGAIVKVSRRGTVVLLKHVTIDRIARTIVCELS